MVYVLLALQVKVGKVASFVVKYSWSNVQPRIFYPRNLPSIRPVYTHNRFSRLTTFMILNIFMHYDSHC